MEYVDGEDLSRLLRRIGTARARQGRRHRARHRRGTDGRAREGHPPSRSQAGERDDRLARRRADHGLRPRPRRRRGRRHDLRHARVHGAGAARRRQPATVQSDLYALGLVMYELFTGKRAHNARTLPERVRDIDQRDHDAVEHHPRHRSGGRADHPALSLERSRAAAALRARGDRGAARRRSARGGDGGGRNAVAAHRRRRGNGRKSVARRGLVAPRRHRDSLRACSRTSAASAVSAGTRRPCRRRRSFTIAPPQFSGRTASRRRESRSPRSWSAARSTPGCTKPTAGPRSDTGPIRSSTGSSTASRASNPNGWRGRPSGPARTSIEMDGHGRLVFLQAIPKSGRSIEERRLERAAAIGGIRERASSARRHRDSSPSGAVRHAAALAGNLSRRRHADSRGGGLVPRYADVSARSPDRGTTSTNPMKDMPFSSSGTAGLFLAWVVVPIIALIGVLLAWRNLHLRRGDRQGALRMAAVVFVCVLTALAAGADAHARPWRGRRDLRRLRCTGAFQRGGVLHLLHRRGAVHPPALADAADRLGAPDRRSGSRSDGRTRRDDRHHRRAWPVRPSRSDRS